MNKQTVKPFVRGIVRFGVGSTVGSIIQTHRKHSDNRAVETTIDAATVVTAYAVQNAMKDTCDRIADRLVDDVADQLTELKQLFK